MNNKIKNYSESKGGDKKRNSTAIILISVLLPALILACTIPLIKSGSSNIINIFSDIYISIFFAMVGVLLIYGIHELSNFIFDKKILTKSYYVSFISLTIICLVLFLAEVINLLADNISIDISYFLIIFPALLIYFCISLIFSMDIKNVMMSIFISMLFLAFILALTYNINIFGWQIIILAISITIVSDTSAYFGGKKWGKKKMFPKISPNKTVEGFVIGLISSIIFGIVFFFIFFTWDSGFIPGVNLQENWLLLIVIPFVAIVSPYGDLTFSKIKRIYGKKDFSNLLPGHGGLFDRIDSHIFTMVTITLLTLVVI